MNAATLPVWRAFGPAASGLSGWAPPDAPLPRTALRILDGKGIHLDAQLHRLAAGASVLGWDVSWLNQAWPDLTAWLSGIESAVGRLQLFMAAISIRLEAIPDPFPAYRLRVTPHPMGDLRGDEKSAHKGILGAWDIQAREQAHENHTEDALLLWPDGSIAETTMAAIGLQVNDQLLLPPMAGRVASITEALELPRWAKAHGLSLQRSPISLDQISCGQLWCMNAVRGLWQAEVVQR